MLVRLMDIHTFSEFNVPFEARWATTPLAAIVNSASTGVMADGELRIVMHRSQLKSLADEIKAVLGDLPAEEDEASSSKVAAPDPIHEIYKALVGGTA